MDDFHYQNGQLFCEKVNIDELIQRVGSPAYIYSRSTFETHYDRLAQAFTELKPTICYSIKSCGNVHICKLLADRGAGMDVVSGGELHRARIAGVAMDKVVYAGVGKTDDEIRTALQGGIGYFNIESEAEFENIAAIARQTGTPGHAALRVNPDIADPKTHAKTTTGKKETKFGVDIERARHVFKVFGHDNNLRLTGIHLHIGSPIYSPQPYVDAIGRALDLIEELKADNIRVNALNFGGGFAADYETGKSPLAADYAARIVPLLKPFVAAGGRVLLEPGRCISANAGVLITRVQYIKLSGRKKFIIVDSGENHLVRPAMYGAFHFVWPTNVAPVHVPPSRQAQLDMVGLEQCDVVGPICETGDFFAKDRPLPPLARGNLIAVFSAGAYGMSMASNYNAMPRPPEVLVSDDQATIIRRRETYDDLVEHEREVSRG